MATTPSALARFFGGILSRRQRLLKIIFAFVIAIHGLIHLMGFAKAFDYGKIDRLTAEISKPLGIL